MIQDHGQDGVVVSYTTSKAEVHAAKDWDSMMRFIINNRPIVVHQFWIDTGKKDDNIPDSYKMLYSKVTPAPDTYSPSDI